MTRRSDEPHPPPSSVTDRQLEVALLIAEGLTDKEIAMILVISEETVAKHVQNIMHRWNLSRTRNVRVQITRRILKDTAA